MKKLINFCNSMDVTTVRVIVLGNSISSGFSLSEKTIPFMFRNKHLIDTLERENIKLELYHFCVAQNNNNEKMLNWMYKNISLDEISNLAVCDDYLMRKQNKKEKYILLEEDKSKYYNLEYGENKLFDLIKDRKKGVYTICVINSCTGTFLDTVTRNRKNKLRVVKIFNALKRDVKYFEQILETLRISNPYIPVFVEKINLVSFLALLIPYANFIINKTSQKYFNSYTVDSVVTKGVYATKEYKILFLDIHPSGLEYQKILKKLNEKIDDNVALHYAKTLFYESFREFVSTYSKKDNELKNFPKDKVEEVYRNCVLHLLSLDYDINSIDKAYSLFYKEYYKNYQYDYYMLDLKKNMNVFNLEL